MKIKRIAFLGDSITEGCFAFYPTSYGLDTYRQPEDCYVTKVAKALKAKYGDDAPEVINAGVSGNKANNGLDRLQKDVLDKKPDIVFVCFGLNDSPWSLISYRNSMSQIFDKLIESGITPILLTPNMKCTYVSDKAIECSLVAARKSAEIQNSGRMDETVEISREVARERGIEICDIYAEWKKLSESGTDITELLSNYINHPTPEMHDFIAERVLKVLEKHLS